MQVNGAVLFATIEENTPRWIEELLNLAPDLDLRVWPDVGNKDEVVFAIVARPPRDELAQYRNLQVVFSMWAGVADLLADESIADLPIVRMTEPGLTAGIVTYVVHHVTGLHIRSCDYNSLVWEHPFRIHNKPPADCCVGILGFGVLGQACATALLHLGFKVIGYSSTRKYVDNVHSYAGENELSSFLSQSDILVCLLPNTVATANMLNEYTLGMLPKGACVINCGRGESIDDDALLNALRSRTIDRAVLDVFRIEPLPPDHPYWSEPNVVVTPHCASKPDPASGSRVILEKIVRFQNGSPIEGIVDRTRAY